MKLWLVCLILGGWLTGSDALGEADNYLSPDAIVATRDGATLFVACGTANRVLWVDARLRQVRRSLGTPAPATGLALSSDERRLYVTCAAPESQVLTVDVRSGKIVGAVAAGHTSVAPILSRDGKTLYVCNQFDNNVSVIDLAAQREVRRIPVRRQPVAADLTKDGRYLLVANHLSDTCANLRFVGAVVSVIDVVTGHVVKELQLPSGSETLESLRISPDGKYAVVTHIFCNYDLPTRRVELGLINANALTIINLEKLELQCTLLLDTPDRGAGNPWGTAFSPDGSTLAVAHAGTHEVSLIDFPALLGGLPAVERKAAWPTNLSTAVLKFVPHYEDEELNDGLPFLVGARQRIKLPEGDLGPRATVVTGHRVYTANYFSDDLSAIDLAAPEKAAESISLGPKKEMTAARRGEFYFHDASLCYQGWQSCSSCHPGGGRVDALNWDLASEGPGHPKNTRSLLLACQMPPVMALGLRADAAVAVHGGIRVILFTNLPEAIPLAMIEYLKTLKPVPSPYLVNGKLSPAARHGEELFQQAGCADCHVPGLYSDLRPHDVGTRVAYDGRADKFYTPTLIEVWRTAPYLHNGAAATIRDVLTVCNRHDLHGNVSGLSRQELDDLCTYVLSL